VDLQCGTKLDFMQAKRLFAVQRRCLAD